MATGAAVLDRAMVDGHDGVSRIIRRTPAEAVAATAIPYAALLTLFRIDHAGSELS
jgi:hypothetical protein